MDANDPAAILTAAFAALRGAQRDPALLKQRLAQADVAEVIGRWPPATYRFDAVGLEQTLLLFADTRNELTAAGTGASIAAHLDDLIAQLHLASLAGEAGEADDSDALGLDTDGFDRPNEEIDGKWPPD